MTHHPREKHPTTSPHLPQERTNGGGLHPDTELDKRRRAPGQEPERPAFERSVEAFLADSRRRLAMLQGQRWGKKC
jgi:hypothetical protein